ncbi:copper fist DNA binding domain-containing protein [Hygrophoropsis aurantiaca]|uniref:Copper fist DNA binding domain-containing protein n=1 Tax=Hygrophoropsis aurantiaca TaxID=72124 RepID=A0ACB7ZW85_9AGAM|nr:copper fist DNA binding domain-containing protein [Hygrophoropsis aurantiaca]
MVIVNDKKFACESCIKGHRSSSCHHTERPLFEVKRKGRPVSQCEKCRELRQSKRVHSKCLCSPKLIETDKVPIPASRPDKKPKRFMPSVPTLPNGISDALPGPSTSTSSKSRQKFDSLLNPCHCQSVWQCRCRTAPTPHAGLATLADAAALCYNETFPSANAEQSISSVTNDRSTQKSCCSRKRRASHISTSSPPRFNLPPILLDSPASSSRAPSHMPEFSIIPPLSEITSIAGTGCTCGLRCACPGCVEHRGPNHTSEGHRDCSDGCAYCVDNMNGIELPGHRLSSGSSRTAMLDQFFARAASLPQPPKHRKLGMTIDPTNLKTYPNELFARSERDHEERGAAYGLVKVPKLDCCGGRCGCPAGRCGCGKSCHGCYEGEDLQEPGKIPSALAAH